MKNYGVNGRQFIYERIILFYIFILFYINNYAFYYIYTFWENFPKEFLKQWEYFPIKLTNIINLWENIPIKFL